MRYLIRQTKNSFKVLEIKKITTSIIIIIMIIIIIGAHRHEF